MRLEGLLVDLVPFDAEFQKLEHTWRNNESNFWAGGGDRNFESRQQVQQIMARRYGGDQTRHGSGVWFGMQTKDGVRIGGMGAPWGNPTHRWAMLGAKIGNPDYWGGGYGTDGLLLLVDYCFEWLDYRRLWLVTTSANVRVQRQMEKVGFTFEGAQRSGTVMDGVWHSWLAYGLLREEWPGRLALVERLGLGAKT
jgi:RimJ/RimL family protein N-acetyltransferase